MELKDVKDVVQLFLEIPYKTLFKALMVYEQLDSQLDLEDLNEDDLKYLDGVYDYFIENDYFTGIVNNEIMEMYKEEKENA